MHKTVYVGGLSNRTQEEDLRDEFCRYGPIVKMRHIKNRYAFIEFETEDDAQLSIRKMDNVRLDGEHIKEEISKSDPERNKDK